MRTAAVVLLVGALAGAATWSFAQHRLRERGAALFDGRLPLTAAVAGHADLLPASAAACSNCHGERSTDPAPPLARASLATARARRGGPPSAYDAAALCRLLRSGIDPAWVTVPRAMPRYTLGEADCAALWAHVSRA